MSDSQNRVFKLLNGVTEMEASEYYFRGDTDKNPLTYRVNEPMTFTVHLEHKGERICVPYYYWQCDGDDGESMSGTVEDDGEDLVITAAVSCPGCLRVRVTACDENKNPIPGVPLFEGGAFADVDSVMKTTELPDDFDAFWAKATEKAEKADIKVIYRKDVTDIGIPDSLKKDYLCEEIELSACDETVTGYLVTPRASGLYAAAAHFMGYSVASAAPTVLYNMLSFTVNGHPIHNGREESYYKALSEGELKAYGFSTEENAHPETCYFLHMIIRDLIAMKFLRSLPNYDGEHLVANGGSQGGFQAIAMGALDKKVTRVTANVPWLCDLYGYKTGRMKGMRPEYAEGLRYFDSANLGTRVTCPIYIRAGLGDYICPPSSVISLYHAIPSNAKYIGYLQNRTHSYLPPYDQRYELSEPEGIRDLTFIPYGEIYADPEMIPKKQ